MILPVRIRTVFVTTLTILATISGTLLAASRLTGEIDLLEDLFKIGATIAVGTAFLSCAIWSVIQRRHPVPWRGAVAGFLTALVIVPLPIMAWTFKIEVLNGFETGFFGTISSVLISGMTVYELMTKASLLALVASACVGFSVVKIMSPPAGTSPRLK